MEQFDTSPEAREIQTEIFRRMSPTQRLQLGIQLTATCNKLLAAGVRQRHPEYDENNVRLAVIRLQLGDALFLTVYPDASDIVP